MSINIYFNIKMKIIFLFFFMYYFIIIYCAEEINYNKNIKKFGGCYEKGSLCDTHIAGDCCKNLNCIELPSKFGTNRTFPICWDKTK
jgi:hypothetical protein